MASSVVAAAQASGTAAERWLVYELERWMDRLYR